MKEFFSSLWSQVKKFFSFLGRVVIRHPLAAALTVLLVVAAVFVALSGKTFQIGGILGKLWGKKKEEVRGVAPEDRKNEDGTPILPGESDDKGFVQAPVARDIVSPGMFSDPSTVTISHPDKGKVVIALPEGVKNKDVHEVVEVKPDVYEVRNKDKGKSVKDIDKLIDKLGK